ncbi:sialidase family protein [Allohahella marinimesophila]|uniref:Uncharacterized protein n=1 Tax=Allohahella marinimesophila TaxID=1054972 RepID=A0ABP7NFV7_9GAMM
MKHLSSHPTRILLTTLLATGLLTGLSGCNNGKTSTPPQTSINGVFFDAPVEGIGYINSRTTRGPAGNFDRAAAAASADGQHILASLGSTGGRLVSSDAGVSWVTDENASAANKVFVSPDGTTMVSWDGSDSSTTSVSTDSGVTWVTRSDFFPCTYPTDLASSADGLILFATGIQSTSGGSNLCIASSTDGGASWTDISGDQTANAPAVLDERLNITGIATSADGRSLAISTTNSPANGPIASGTPDLVNGFIYTSSDAGLTWNQRGLGLEFLDIASSADGRHLLAASATGVHVSDTNGVTWTDGPVFGQPVTELETLIAMSADGRRLLMTANRGATRISEDGGTSWSLREETANAGMLAFSADSSLLIMSPPALEATADTFQVLVEKISDYEYTDKTGSYQCLPGSRTTFYLGSSVLGTANCAEVTHVLQMAGPGEDPEKGLVIAQFLQSIDENRVVDDEGQSAASLSTQQSVVREFKDELARKLGNKSGSSKAKAIIRVLKKYQRRSLEKVMPFAFIAKLPPPVREDYLGEELSTNEDPKHQTLVSREKAQEEMLSALNGLNPGLKKSICADNGCPPVLQDIINPATEQRIGGVVANLPEGREFTLTLVQSNSAAEVLKIAQNGAYKFTSSTTAGQAYTVALDQSSLGANVSCALPKASGTVPKGNIEDINVICTTLLYLPQIVGGTVTGLAAGQSVSLSITPDGTDATQSVQATTNGPFTFPGNLLADTLVSIAQPVGSPSSAVCVSAKRNITVPRSYTTTIFNPIEITCSTQAASYAINGTIAGLGANDTIMVNNTDSASGTTVSLTQGNGEFAFIEAFTGTFNLSVSSLPSGFGCTLSESTGSPGEGDDAVTVAITCEAALTSYTIGGTASGVPSGESLTISNMDSDTGQAFQTVSANGAYAFIEDFTGNFSLSFLGLPSGLSCGFSTASGTPQFPTVTSNITCSGARLSGAVSGLGANANVELLATFSTGAQGYSLTDVNATFTSLYLQPGTTYDVTVSSTSAGTTCDPVQNGTGTIGTSNVSNISLTCTTDVGSGPAAGSLGGTVSGLLEQDTVEVEDLEALGGFVSVIENGPFTLPNGLQPGDPYDISATIFEFMPGTGDCQVTSGGVGTMPAIDATPNYVDDIVITCTY